MYQGRPPYRRLWKITKPRTRLENSKNSDMLDIEQVQGQATQREVN